MIKSATATILLLSRPLTPIKLQSVLTYSSVDFKKALTIRGYVSRFYHCLIVPTHEAAIEITLASDT